MSFNKVIMEGHLCRDIEVKFAQNTGAPYARTAIAVNSVSGSGDNKKESVCFLDITFFGRCAEIARDYLKKGSHVLIDGELKYETWQDQNGQNRSKHSMLVHTMQMLDTKNTENSRAQNATNENSNNAKYEQSNEVIPF